ncbi:PsiF family protein [Ideonella sp. DXS29W]|uniref:PsiF family protein n=1 Tax=Ideonella lacteola TaxID=2984193 RepID=A0ABU9BKA6_9BURK
MKQILISLALVAVSTGSWAQAASAPEAASAPAKTAQQEKMGRCNAEAAGKTGDERKAFMKECLSAKKASQTDKMKTCNEQAKGKKGDERKAFMKECLSA